MGAWTLVTARSETVRKRYPELARILDLLSTAKGVRQDVVDDIREQIQRGKFLTEEKLNIAISRLLKEILG